MKLMKPMLVAALVAGSLFTSNTTVLAQPAAGGAAPGAAAPGGPGGGAGARRGGMQTPDAYITRIQAALGETNKLSEAVIAKVKPVLDKMIKAQTDLRADTTLSQEDRMTKRTAITKEASDAIKALVTADQFKVIEPLLQQRGGRRGGAGGAPATPPPAAAPPQA